MIDGIVIDEFKLFLDIIKEESILLLSSLLIE